MACLEQPAADYSGISQMPFLVAIISAEGADILGSVGAYRLEGRGAQLFEHINGDYFAIPGLALLELLGFLRTRGMIVS